jgi:hypothetical protein
MRAFAAMRDAVQYLGIAGFSGAFRKFHNEFR